MNRTISGDALVRHLTQDERTIDRALVTEHGRSARTLVKEGPLRLTLVALDRGGVMPRHRAEGPVTVQLLDGDATIEAIGNQYTLAVGDVIVLAGGVEHDVRSVGGATFLLTVVFLGRENSPDASSTI